MRGVNIKVGQMWVKIVVRHLFGPVDEIIFIHVSLHKVHLAGNVEFITFFESFFLCFRPIRGGTFVGGYFRSTPQTARALLLTDAFGTPSLSMSLSLSYFGGVTFAVSTHYTGGQAPEAPLTQGAVGT